MVFTWLCAALAATLVVFSMFPDSVVGGKVIGFTLGGAGAFVMLVWTAAIRAARVAGRRDDLELAFLTTLTSFSAPGNVTLDELRIESYFPLDEATERACGALD